MFCRSAVGEDYAPVVSLESPPPAEQAGAAAPRPQPVFYYDFAGAECYLAAERVVDALGVVPVWEPVRSAELPGGDAPAFRCAQERDIYQLEVERRAAAYGTQPLRWPPDWPAEYELALRVAAYAKSIGRVVAFSLAAFRQQFNAGRGLNDIDNVLLAAAAAELHPNAVLQAIERQAIKDRLRVATEDAIARGVQGVPTVRVGDDLFWGDDRLEDAAAACDSVLPRS